jgi:hypothetical protein
VDALDALDHDEMLELGQDSEESVSDDDAPPSTVKDPTFIHHNMSVTLMTTPAHTCSRSQAIQVLPHAEDELLRLVARPSSLINTPSPTGEFVHPDSESPSEQARQRKRQRVGSDSPAEADNQVESGISIAEAFDLLPE